NFSWHGVSVHQPVGPPRWQPRPLLEAIFASGAPRTPSSVARSQTAATRGSAVSPAGGPLPRRAFSLGRWGLRFSSHHFSRREYRLAPAFGGFPFIPDDLPVSTQKIQDTQSLDALTGGAFSAPTSGERAARVRDWLATDPSHEQMLEV